MKHPLFEVSSKQTLRLEEIRKIFEDTIGDDLDFFPVAYNSCGCGCTTSYYVTCATSCYLGCTGCGDSCHSWCNSECYTYTPPCMRTGWTGCSSINNE